MKNMPGNGGTAVDARRGAVRRHVGRYVSMLGTVIAMIVGTAGVAVAAPLDSQRCQFQAGHHSVCIHIIEGVRSRFKVLGDVWSQYDVIVDIDLVMSQAEAQKIIDAPEHDDDKFTSALIGADFLLDSPLGPILLTSPLPSASAGGLSLSFHAVNFSRDLLDEDVGNDEVFASVNIIVPSRGIKLRFTTPEISHGF